MKLMTPKFTPLLGCLSPIFCFKFLAACFIWIPFLFLEIHPAWVSHHSWSPSANWLPPYSPAFFLVSPHWPELEILSHLCFLYLMALNLSPKRPTDSSPKSVSSATSLYYFCPSCIVPTTCKHHMCNPHNTPIKVVILLSAVFRWRNWRSLNTPCTHILTES